MEKEKRWRRKKKVEKKAPAPSDVKKKPAGSQRMVGAWKVKTFVRSSNDKKAGQEYEEYVSPCGRTYRSLTQALAAGFVLQTVEDGV